MDKTVARLGTDLKNQPDVEAALRTTLGIVYLGLDDTAKAEAMQREALALRRRMVGEDHLDVATSLNQLAVVLNVRGDLPAAEAALRDALRIRRALLKPPHALVAEQFQRDALTELRRWFSSSLWTPAAGKVSALQSQEKAEEIEAALADAINLRTKLLDGSNLQTAWARQNLAVLLLTYGDLSGSEMLGREALDLVRHIAGPTSWEASASLAFLLGVLLEEKKFADAEPLARDCLALREKLRPDDWRTCYARSLLGAALLGQEKL